MKEMSARCQKRNEPFGFTLDQTRNKFKKLMSICKNAFLTIKTASSIKRFQDEKEHGKWFDILHPLMETCQPDQAVEQSAAGALMQLKILRLQRQILDQQAMDLVTWPLTMQLWMTAKRQFIFKENLFVPVKARLSCKSSVSKKIETTNLQVIEVLWHIKSVLEKESNSTKIYLTFLREKMSEPEDMNWNCSR